MAACTLCPPRIPLLSFFTGGGFLDIGFSAAGFPVIWTNENDHAIADLYEAGMTSYRTSRWMLPHRLKITNRRNIKDLKARDVLRQAFGEERPLLFGIIGGPPCPDFSNGGKHAGHNGAQGSLTSVFIKMIWDIQPSFFVIENVAGLYTFHKHRRFLEQQLADLERYGRYAVDFRILNALELGVPQDRERLFVVGMERELVRNVLGRRVKLGEKEWFYWPHDRRYAEAKRLPWPKVSKFGSTPRLPDGIPMELTVYSILAGEVDPESLPNGLEYYTPKSRKIFEREEGNIYNKSFKRLHRYRYSPTAWYGNREIHLHPWKPRRLSVREALRIQTVPDEYVLPDGAPLSPKFRMICNGVPCRMAECLARRVAEFIEDSGALKAVRSPQGLG